MKKRLPLLRMLACSYFAVPGLLNIGHTLLSKQPYFKRDVIILMILLSPLLINKRWYYLGFGTITAIATLILTIVFAVQNFPAEVGSSLAMYISGCAIYSCGIAASVTMIYIGTYSNIKGRFCLV